MKKLNPSLTVLASTLLVLVIYLNQSNPGKPFFTYEQPSVNTGRGISLASPRQHFSSHLTAKINPTRNISYLQNAQAIVSQIPDYRVEWVRLPGEVSRAESADQAEAHLAVESKAAGNPEAVSPALQALVKQVADGEANVVRGIFVEDYFALPIVQQPVNDWPYVSTDQGVLTQFQSTAPSVIGLLGHNYLAGHYFFNLKKGQQIVIVYGDGKIERYQVSEIHSYQKLEEDNLYSPFIDQQNGQWVSSSAVSSHVYAGGKHLTLQTCIEKDGDWSWGLYFVIATPVS